MAQSMTETESELSPGHPEAPKPERPKPWMGHPFRRKNLRPRVVATVLAAIALLFASNPSETSAAFGLPVIAAGAALRIWATGHLVKTDEFTVSGPYAYVRHPLYLGTLAIGTGFALFAGWPVVAIGLPVFWGLFFGYYFPRKERLEGDRLEQLYGDRYRAYRRAVRALVPSLRPWPDAAQTGGSRWSVTRFRENDELGTTVTVVLALVAMILFD